MSISKYDKALFIWKYHENVQGILVVHVDDFLWCGSSLFYSLVIQKMRSIFKISKESEGIFKYVCISLNQQEDELILEQRNYVNNIQPLDIPPESNGAKHKEVDGKMRRKFRGLVGQLSWASGISRPDASFSACALSTVQSKPTYKDIMDANKAIRDLKSNPLLLKYPRMDLANVRLVVHSDASYGNLKGGGSQGGFIVFISDKDGFCSPVAWASKRIKRVVRSTLSAETLAAVDAVDAAYLISKILAEVIGRGKEEEIPINLHTDNKSLYDAINTTNLVLDKSWVVDIAALREMNEWGEIHFCWVDSSHQLADTLTKKGASKKKLFDILRLSHMSD